MATADKESHYVDELFAGTCTSLKMVIPLQHHLSQIKTIKQYFHLEFGVFIGITGDIKGKLVLSSDPSVFSVIAKEMFGMPLEDEMLHSFCGELGNMIAGGLSTIIVESGIKTVITAPTIINGNTKISGYQHAINIPVTFERVGLVNIYILID